MPRIPRHEFEQFVDEAWQAIPESFRNRFSNVALFVQDEPEPDQLRDAGVPPGGTRVALPFFRALPRAAVSVVRY